LSSLPDRSQLVTCCPHSADNSSEPSSEAAQELETLAVSEPAQQRPVRNDCDVDAVLRRYRSSSKDNEQLRDWLRESRAVSVSQWLLANTRYKRYPLLEKPPEGGFFANAFV